VDALEVGLPGRLRLLEDHAGERALVQRLVDRTEAAGVLGMPRPRLVRQEEIVPQDQRHGPSIADRAVKA
jgi:hypothetical protein